MYNVWRRGAHARRGMTTALVRFVRVPAALRAGAARVATQPAAAIKMEPAGGGGSGGGAAYYARGDGGIGALGVALRNSLRATAAQRGARADAFAADFASGRHWGSAPFRGPLQPVPAPPPRDYDVTYVVEVTEESDGGSDGAAGQAGGHAAAGGGSTPGPPGPASGADAVPPPVDVRVGVREYGGDQYVFAGSLPAFHAFVEAGFGQC